MFLNGRSRKVVKRLNHDGHTPDGRTDKTETKTVKTDFQD
jgi:hypothetical protein